MFVCIPSQIHRLSALVIQCFARMFYHSKRKGHYSALTTIVLSEYFCILHSLKRPPPSVFDKNIVRRIIKTDSTFGNVACNSSVTHLLMSAGVGVADVSLR